MILSDKTIGQLLKAGDIGIYPPPESEQMQPVSVDLHLSNSFVVWPMYEKDQYRNVVASDFILAPQTFALGSTKESVKLPAHIMAEVHGKSTLARKGLQVHAAGLVDPGFIGTLTLELFNMSNHPIPLPAGMPICQISFHLLDVACARPYGTEGLRSHYQGQLKATPASE